MNISEMPENFLYHVGFGIAASLFDYTKVAVRSDKNERIADKMSYLKSMDIILKANPQTKPVDVTLEDAVDSSKTASKELSTVVVKEPSEPAVSKDSKQYAQNVYALREYFIKQGVIKKNLSLSEKVSSYFKNWTREERWNNKDAKGKWVTALYAELVVDSGLYLFTQLGYTGMSAAENLTLNIYQIPAFRLGMVIGNGIKNTVYKPFVESGDERKLNKRLEKLQKETDIVDLVFNFEPSQKVQEDLEKEGFKAYGMKLTGAGKKILTAMGKSVVNVTDAIGKRREVAKLEDTRRREDWQNKFNDLTKGR